MSHKVKLSSLLSDEQYFASLVKKLKLNADSTVILDDEIMDQGETEGSRNIKKDRNENKTNSDGNKEFLKNHGHTALGVDNTGALHHVANDSNNLIDVNMLKNRADNIAHKLHDINKKIKDLEIQVYFQQQENSSCMKLFRYRQFAIKLYERLCKYRNQEPLPSHILFNRLNFSGSKMPEMNRAINRTFKSNTCFPTYNDVELCLRKCVEDNNIHISEADFKLEATSCFEKVRNLLQYRRKMNILNLLNTNFNAGEINEE